VRRVLGLLAGPATRAPKTTLVALLVATFVFAIAAGDLQVNPDTSEFAPDDGLNAALESIDDRFGAGPSFQVILDTGPGGNILTPEGLRLGGEMSHRIRTDASVEPFLAEAATDRPPVITFAEPFRTAATSLGLDPDDLDPAMADVLVRSLLQDEIGEMIRPLLSQDLDVQQPSARGALAVIELRDGTTETQLLAAVDAVSDVMTTIDAPGVAWWMLSDAGIERDIEERFDRDVPVLMSLSLLLVVGVLAWLFRSVSDVVVGFAGLVASIIWMAGAAALLGPTGLGWVGPFGQVAVAVPVLLIGLGVDYSVHLTTRYREQQARGDDPARAASVAVHTVGVALVLATLATMGGFLANLATPLPPIADMGVFASIGILAAFVILGMAVPATRVMLDERQLRRGGRRAAVEAAEPRAAESRAASVGQGRLAAAGTHLAVDRTRVVGIATLVVLLLAGLSATRLGTEFNPRDFLPDRSPVEALVERVDTLFGADVGEQTYVLVDGDATDPDLLAAAARFERDLADLDAVEDAGGQIVGSSPFEVVRRLGESAARARAGLATNLDNWADPEGAAARIDIPDTLDASRLVTADDDEALALPAALRDAIARRLPAGRSPVAALAAASDPRDVVEEIRAGLREEFAASRPAGLSDEALARLAALEPDELRLERLQAEGFPMSALDPDQRATLALADRLQDAGWTPDRQELSPDAVLAQLAIARDEEPQQVAASLADDGILIVARTAAGQSRASALSDDIHALAGGVRDAGGEVTVTSRALVNTEIVDRMSSAQLLAIVISLLVAAGLLVVATWLSDRSVVLGLIGIAPAVVALVAVLGTMPLLGLTFNALTATVASIAVGIGVPYGIHLTNRFRSSLAELGEVTDAIRDTLANTGGALVGSAITTGLAFGVLMTSSNTPLRQFGGVSAMMIVYALLACLLLQPALLVLWARRRAAGQDGRRAAGAGSVDVLDEGDTVTAHDEDQELAVP
jgi:predicted RND superfamily exporter protein